jgi:hypothetical protein
MRENEKLQGGLDAWRRENERFEGELGAWRRENERVLEKWTEIAVTSMEECRRENSSFLEVL